MRTSLFTVVGLITISGLAFTIIGIVIARSPYTHGNLSPQGYDRTQVAILGEEYPFEGLGLADPFVTSGDSVQDGRLLFFQYGCRSCHGSGTGAIVGEDLDDVSPSEVRREVRDGPGGMPAYSASLLSDDELESIIAFLRSAESAPSEATDAETTSLPPDAEGRHLKGGSFLERIDAVLATILERVAAWKTGATKGFTR